MTMLTDTMSVVRGDDYYNSDNRAFLFNLPFGADCPDLSNCTVTASWYLQIGVASALQKVCTVQNAKTGAQRVMIELTSAQTALLTGPSYYVALVAELNEPGTAPQHQATIMRIACTVTAPPG